MNYKTVFQLAQDKGYNPEFNVNLEPKELNSQFADHYPEQGRYIDLCLIQKWLRDEHKIAVFVVRASFGHYGYEIFPDINKSGEHEAIKGKGFLKMVSTYEAALLEGINEALKLVP